MRIATAKQTYQADEALFDTRVQRLWLLFLAAALALFPFVADAYWLYLACLVAINVASATGLNILTGYTGLVSRGKLPSWAWARTRWRCWSSGWARRRCSTCWQPAWWRCWAGWWACRRCG